MKKSLLFLGLLLIHVASFEQLSKGGTPPGIGLNLRWAATPLYEMPPVDVARLLREDSIRELDATKPIRFGKATEVSIKPGATGAWQVLPNGNHLWQQRIRSAGAFSLSLGFRNMSLPPDSRLFIYNRDHSSILGAFTNELIYTEGILATEQLNGEEIIVEYEVSERYVNQPPFELYRVSHDYRNINKLLEAFGEAGACQTNINCPVGANYQDVKKGVAAIIASGSDLCTGTLINTTNNSGIPYFLTANHCYEGSSGNVASWVFRFNWESPTCANPSSNPSFQSVSGSTLKARSAGSDFCLVQITTAPPANYNVAYIGWDRSGTAPSSQVCISHPSVDIKKICTAATPATTGTYNSAVCWKTGTWANGCTEPGSSGSSLLDQNKRIVGQLYGGPSACGQPASNMYDFYGKLSVSWTGGGTNDTRLSNWLDPTGTNATTTNIYDPNLDAALTAINNPAATEYCATAFTPNVTIKNNGAATLTSLTISYQVDNGSVATSNWTGSLTSGSSTNVSLSNFNSTAGLHNLLVYASQANGSIDNNKGNDTVRTTFTILNTTPRSVPFTESFEGATFPPADWTVSGGPAASFINWKKATVGYTGSGSALKNNYDDNNSGQESNLNSPFFNFPFATGNYWLSFRVAYAQYNSTISDSLKIAVSTDCGATWNIIYRKGGAGLATAPPTLSAFTPTASQWRNDSVSLNAFRNKSGLRFRFINYNNYGNNLYIDDINITGPTCPGSSIVYVDSARGESGNGTSWASAYKTLQEGLEAAQKCASVTQVWVKKGTYYPTAANNRDSAFLVQRNGIKLYGGFGDTDTTMATRNPGAYPTVLSGSVGGGTTGDNVYHIMIIVATPTATIDTTTRIDGFTFTGGTANSFTAFQAAGQTLYHDNGGGIYCFGLGSGNSCKPMIANCRFSDNYAANRGGAIFNEGYNNGNCSPAIVNCTFFNNTAGVFGGSGGTDYGGAAIYNNGFQGNSSPTILNCSVYGNNSNNGAGAVCNFYGGNAVITNCILYGNTSVSGNANLANAGSVTSTVSYSIVQGGFAGTGNLNVDPLFVAPTSGNLQLQQCSPAINQGNAAALLPGIPTDIAGAARIFNATVDIGAYECLLLPTVFTFKGAGNWNTVLNWQCNWIPPSPLVSGSEIVVDPVGGDCILNVPFRVGPGGKLAVKTGKKLLVQGGVLIQ